MDTVYSIGLLISILAAVTAVGLGSALLLRGKISQSTEPVPGCSPIAARTRGWVHMAIGLAALAGALSLSVHVFFGHAPGTRDELSFWELLRIHPAYVVVSILVITALGLLKWATSDSNVNQGQN